MRDYIKLEELEEVLSKTIDSNTASEIMQCVKEEAETCLCHAYSPSECTCGAWDNFDDNFNLEDKD